MNNSHPSQVKNPVHSKIILPKAPLNEAYLPSPKSVTQEGIERLQYEAGGNPLDMNAKGERLNPEGDSVNSEDTNFKNELEFDGYQDIAEYDNDAYSLNVEQKPDSAQPLNFVDRTENPTGEESPVDVQENKKAH
ncbi:MAG: hypothetical protein H7333_01640 [Bdellovibrionales bacterium]|nr:hypothetical protein [Oligoflexia bacterium]